jgi:putative nucleotidyltransferase with HDIG domain
MDYSALLHDLEQMLQETYALWDEGWVTFNWRGYTYDHVQRVRGLAVNLCRQEGGDVAVTELAALLHDITKPYDGEYLVDENGKRVVDEHGYWQNEVRRPTRQNHVTELYETLGLAGTLHNDSGAVLARHLLLEHGVDEELADRVAGVIRDHLIPAEDVPIESRCLYDADTIDANVGLPAFVRNIYINLHFYDARHANGGPPIATVLRDRPLEFLQPYVTENLPRWSEGKRRDFVPKLLTAAGRRLSEERMDRLDGFFACMAQELDGFSANGRHDCLNAVLHYMLHTDDPSISFETAYLAERWLSPDDDPQVCEFVRHLREEMDGVE